MNLRLLKNILGISNLATYWLDVQMGPSKNRYSIVKNFEFIDGFKGRIFLNQIDCIDKGKQYRWLVYKPRGKNYHKKLCELVDGWTRYYKELKKNVSIDSEVLNRSVQCRILALDNDEEQLSWNYTMYEKELCIIERTPADGSYEKDNTIIIMDVENAGSLEKSFVELWDVCPTIDFFIKSKIEICNRTDQSKISTKHSEFAHAFFLFLGSEYHKHVPIYKLGRELHYVRLTLFITVGLLIVSSVPFLIKLFHQFMAYIHHT